MGRSNQQTKSRKKRKKDKDKKLKKGWRTAATSDRHELYELSVQEPELECDLIDQVWKELRGRTCHLIREDFCGTAAVCGEWVKRRDLHAAIGVDIDASVLDWARKRMEQRLDDSQTRRVELIESDVLTAQTRPVDSVLAMNFSYFLLKTRAEVIAYFRSAHAALVDDGMFLLDCYGGSDSFSEMEEERHLDGFTYVWDQNRYFPVTGTAINHIHFRFPDGSEMREAFTYNWRLWTLPEIQEMLLEAGFADVAVYWEGTDEDGEGNGEWTIDTEGEACPGWIAYLAAQK